MAKQARGGRPTGSKTNEYRFIEEVPAACRVCGSTKLTVIDGYAPQITDGGGMRPDGRIFVRIERRPKICECGQRYMVMAFIPPAEEKTTIGSFAGNAEETI